MSMTSCSAIVPQPAGLFAMYQPLPVSNAKHIYDMSCCIPLGAVLSECMVTRWDLVSLRKAFVLCVHAQREAIVRSSKTRKCETSSFTPLLKGALQGVQSSLACASVPLIPRDTMYRPNVAVEELLPVQWAIQ